MTKKRSIILSLGQLFFVTLLIFGMTSSTWCAQSDYDGTYAGTFEGDDDGYWVARIDTIHDIYAFLSYSTNNETGDLGFLSWLGEAGGIGTYHTNSTEIQDSWIDADINSADGSVNGSWGNIHSGDNGTLEGDELTSSAYAGTYEGKFSGDDSGTWEMTITSNGYVYGTITSNSGGGGDFEGGCHPAGYVLLIGEADNGDGFAMFGKISGSDITGEWIAEDGSEGTIGPASNDDDGGGGGGGGGGGCFILSLINK
jgi:hypothetical protein